MKPKETKLAATNEPMTLEESFHNCLFYFLQAIEVLALDADEQCKVMGNCNVAWEIQHDVLDGGTALIHWPIDYLSEFEKGAIAQLTTPLKELPNDALKSDYKLAMNHPSWGELRLAATLLTEQLADVAQRNREFFDIQKLQK